MFTRKLGEKKAKMVMEVLSSEKNSRNFGFIKIKEKELAELASLYNPVGMPLCPDVYAFRAGVWMVMVVVQGEYVDVSLVNPYDPSEYHIAVE